MARILAKILHQAKDLALRHKKKIILVVFIVALGYFVRKKMTMDHVLTLVNGVYKIVQHLPLPESPGMR